jgi:superoxide dismutase, Cu-Zn family
MSPAWAGLPGVRGGCRPILAASGWSDRRRQRAIAATAIMKTEDSMTSKRFRARLGAAVGVGAMAAVGVLAFPGASQAHDLSASAVIRAADGARLGVVRFTVTRDATVVRARLRLPAALGGWNAFHGFHIHANDNPANGSGCLADPAAAPTTWFVSADGHLSDLGQTHGAHTGDLPSILINLDGTADIRFTSARLSLADLAGHAVIVHAGPDNFGNVPLGTGPDRYTPNSPAATTKTAATGNAGDRIGCGVISTD